MSLFKWRSVIKIGKILDMGKFKDFFLRQAMKAKMKDVPEKELLENSSINWKQKGLSLRRKWQS